MVVVVVVLRSHRVQFVDEPPPGCGVVRHCALVTAASAARIASIGPVEQADRPMMAAKTAQYRSNLISFQLERDLCLTGGAVQAVKGAACARRWEERARF